MEASDARWQCNTSHCQDLSVTQDKRVVWATPLGRRLPVDWTAGRPTRARRSPLNRCWGGSRSWIRDQVPLARPAPERKRGEPAAADRSLIALVGAGRGVG